jgi:4-coumarate--CoA ligase
MTIFTSTRQPIAISDTDIYSFVFGANEFNTTRSQDRPLLIDGLTGNSISFKESKELSASIANGWKENVGLKKGDVVAVFSPNQYDHAILYFSLLAAQCTVSPGYEICQFF